MINYQDIKTLSGIDTLYYFLVTKREAYEDVFKIFEEEAKRLDEQIRKDEHPVIEFNGHEFYIWVKHRAFTG